jgi:hypothetical protein
MKTLRVSVTAEDIAAAEAPGIGKSDWWGWPLEHALEGLTGEDVDVDGGDGSGCIATIGASDSPVTLVVDLPDNASEWLDRRWLTLVSQDLELGRERIPGEPFFFELALPDWLCALVEGAS